MANPYSGYTLVQLNQEKSYLQAFLRGESMESFGGQGSNWKRPTLTREQAQQSLVLIEQAINALSGTVNPSRTVFRSA